MSLFLAIVILVPNITQAYFQSKGGENDFLRSGDKFNLNKNENEFVLYDNFNPDKIDKEQILFPKLKFFISVDSISIAFPLSIVFYNYTTTENALADLLYANLKMKKLIEEYKDIRDRGKKMIWDSQYLFQQGDNTDSIYHIVRRFKKPSIQATDDSNVFFTFTEHSLVENRVNSFRPSFDRNNRLKPNLQSIVNRRTSANNIGSVQNHSYEGQDEEKRYEGETQLSKKVTSNTYSEGSEPFIITLFIKLANIIPYLIANKDEAVFYGIGLILTFLFFSSILKR